MRSRTQAKVIGGARQSGQAARPSGAGLAGLMPLADELNSVQRHCLMGALSNSLGRLLRSGAQDREEMR